MSKKIRTLLIVILSLVFITSAGMFISREIDYKKGEALYDDALKFVIEDPAAEEVPPEAPEEKEPEEEGPPPIPPLTMDFDAMAEINPDIVAWINLPGTKINYPVLIGETNDTYLRHAYNGQYSRMGSIFIDYRCASDFSDRHTIVYGHNMRNGTMFSILLRYADQSFYNKHPYFYIYTAEGRLRYDIFSAYMEKLPSDSFTIGFKTDEAFGEFVPKLTAKTVVATDTFPDGEDRVVTLSTCPSSRDRSRRFVVHGYLTEDTRP